MVGQDECGILRVCLETCISVAGVGPRREITLWGWGGRSSLRVSGSRPGKTQYAARMGVTLGCPICRVPHGLCWADGLPACTAVSPHSRPGTSARWRVRGSCLEEKPTSGGRSCLPDICSISPAHSTTVPCVIIQMRGFCTLAGPTTAQ